MFCFLYFFFFQAEDGIRDRNVTGVQTCALPIFIVPPQHKTIFFYILQDILISSYIKIWICRFMINTKHKKRFLSKLRRLFQLMRSEERRVGKECRSQW